MSIDGIQIFRAALLVEAASNIGSLIPILLAPERTLSYIVQSPAYINPVLTSLTQWLAALIVLATIPLLMSYPEPGPSQPPSLVTALRRLTYFSMGASEIVLAVIMARQYMSRDSGLTESFLLIATGTFVGLVGIRAFFLFGKPEWMEAKAIAARSK